MRYIKWFLFLFFVAFLGGVGYYWHMTYLSRPAEESAAVQQPDTAVEAPAGDRLETARQLADNGNLEQAASLLLEMANSPEARDRYEVRLLGGRVLLELERYPEAFGQLEAAVRLRPGQVETIRLLARAARGMGDVQAAAAVVVDGARQAPGDAALQREAGAVLLDSGRAKEALEFLRRARGGKPDAEVWGLEGRALSALGQNTMALEAFRRAASMGLQDGQALLEFGLLAYRKKRFREAYAALKRAVKKIPDNADAHYYLALLCDSSNRRADAIRSYRMALIHDREIVAREDRGMLAELRKRVQTALVMAPGNPETLYEAGFLAYLDGDLEEALNLLESFLAKRSAKRSVRTEGEALAQRIRRELYPEPAVAAGPAAAAPAVPKPPLDTGSGVNYQLVQSFKNRLHRDPKNPRLHYYLGLCYLQGRDSAQAVKHLKDALDLNQTMAEGHLYLGAAYQHQGMVREAVRHLEEAVRLVPQNADAHTRLGAVYLMDVGDAARAVEHLRAAVALCPGFATGHNLLGDAYRLSGDLDNAYASYRQAAFNGEKDSPVTEYAARMMETIAASRAER